MTTRELPCCLATREGHATRLAISAFLQGTRLLRHDSSLSRTQAAERCQPVKGHRCLRDDGAWTGVAKRWVAGHQTGNVQTKEDAFRLWRRGSIQQYDYADTVNYPGWICIFVHAVCHGSSRIYKYSPSATDRLRDGLRLDHEV